MKLERICIGRVRKKNAECVNMRRKRGSMYGMDAREGWQIKEVGKRM